MKPVTHALGWLVCLSALAGCHPKQASSTQETRAAQDVVRPLRDVRKVGKIKPELLTSSKALLVALEKIRDRAPPEDYSNSASVEGRRRFYEAELHRILPEHSIVLVPLGCTAHNGPLTFDPDTKNIVVELLLYDHKRALELQRYVQDQLQQVIDRLFEDEKFAVTTNGGTLLASDEPKLSREEEEKIVDFVYPASVIKTPAGPSIGFFNSPAPAWSLGLAIALSQAALHNEQFRNAILQGDPHVQPGTFLSPLRKEIARWDSFPIGPKYQGLFQKRVPYSGPAKDLCLAGAIRDADLHHGGVGGIPFMDQSAQLVGTLTGWFVYESDGRIVAKALGTREQVQ